MKIFNHEIIIQKIATDEQLKRAILDQAEQNAKKGYITAQLELRHHELLLEQAPSLKRTEEEIKGYEQAIERDKKSINNWETQLRAINYERDVTKN